MKKLIKRITLAVTYVLVATLTLTYALSTFSVAANNEPSIEWTLDDLEKYTVICMDDDSKSQKCDDQNGDQYIRGQYWTYVDGVYTKTNVKGQNTNRIFWYNYYDELLNHETTKVSYTLSGNTLPGQPKLTISEGGYYELKYGLGNIFIDTDEDVFILVDDGIIPYITTNSDFSPEQYHGGSYKTNVTVYVPNKTDVIIGNKNGSKDLFHSAYCHIIAPRSNYYGGFKQLGCAVVKYCAFRIGAGDPVPYEDPKDDDPKDEDPKDTDPKDDDPKDDDPKDEDPIEEPIEEPIEDPKDDDPKDDDPKDEDPKKDPEEDPKKDPEEDPKKDPEEDPKKDPEEDPKKDPEEDPKKDPDNGGQAPIEIIIPLPDEKDDTNDDTKEEPTETITEELPEVEVPLSDTPDDVEYEDLDDEDVPLSDGAEEMAELEEDDVPLSDNPMTGDALPLLPLALTTLTGLTGLFVGLKKRK